jgi:hypothetical protein
MLGTLWPILLDLRLAFTNQVTFMWFCAAVVGICAGSDDLGGMTSVTRNLLIRVKDRESSGLIACPRGRYQGRKERQTNARRERHHK